MTDTHTTLLPMTFIGGGNMASALIGGLRRQGLAGELIEVVEPVAEQPVAIQPGMTRG